MKKLTILLLSILALSCSKEDEPRELSSENEITSFVLNIDGEEFQGQIDQQERMISFETEGKDVSSLKPTVNISERATIEPSPDLSQDFTKVVPYTVYAEDGSPNVYRVIVNNRPISSDNEINSFAFEVDGQTIEAVIERETGIIYADITSTPINALAPVISLPDYATIDPPAEEVQDFTAPVTYTVTAENGDSRTYIVRINEPEIHGIYGGYRGQKFYVGAEAGITGRFLMNGEETSELYLFDGANKYELEQKEFHFSYNDTGTGVSYYAASFVIPDDLPTNIYTIVLEKRGYRIEYDGLDVMAENAPDPKSLSQEVFERDDVLKIYGENLTAGIVVPSNGSHYILYNTYRVDISVNEERTETTFKPTYNQHNLYPSYYGREPEEKKITFFDESGRTGRSIKTIFK